MTHSAILMRTSNFGAKAEQYVLIFFFAENVLKMFLNLHGIMLQTLYHLMTLMVWKLFWNSYK